MKIILVAGASGSGKTELANRLLTALNEADKKTELIIMDSYFKEIPENIEIDEYRRTTNFDKFTMYERELLKNDILQLNRGNPISKYNFEFTTNKRHRTGQILPPEYLIIEGLFAIHLMRLLPKELSITTVSVVTSSYKTIINRRIKRDEISRNRKPEETIHHENTKVGVAFFNNIASSLHRADISVDNDYHNDSEPHPIDIGVNNILSFLKIEKITNSGNIRPIRELAETCEIRHQAGAENQSVQLVHEDSSTVLMPNLAESVEFQKRSIEENSLEVTYSK